MPGPVPVNAKGFLAALNDNEAGVAGRRFSQRSFRPGSLERQIDWPPFSCSDHRKEITSPMANMGMPVPS